MLFGLSRRSQRAVNYCVSFSIRPAAFSLPAVLISETRPRGLGRKKSAHDRIGKFALGVMLLDKLLKFNKVFSMHSLQIASVDVLAILSEMGTHAVSLDIRFGGGMVFLKTGRIIFS